MMQGALVQGAQQDLARDPRLAGRQAARAGGSNPMRPPPPPPDPALRILAPAAPRSCCGAWPRA